MLPKIISRLKRGRGGGKGPERRLRVYMDTNQTCNLACRMCVRSAYSTVPLANKSMEWALFEKIAREVFPLAEHVSLSCGVEPLLSDIFLRALKHTVDCGVPSVAFVTNGTLLNRENIGAIIDTGAHFMVVSIDSADKATFERLRRGAFFDKVVRNLELFKSMKAERGATKPALRINAVLMRSTIEGVEDLMRLAHRLGAEGVIFQHLLVYRSLHIEGESLCNYRDLANAHIRKAKALAKELDFKFFHIPDEFTDAAPAADAMPRCGLPNSILINVSGDVSPCQALLLREPAGNLARQSFDEIWNSPAYVKLRADFAAGRYPETCRTCPVISGGCASDATVLQEIVTPELDEMARLIMNRAPFEEVFAWLQRKPEAAFALVKPEYDLLSDKGDAGAKRKQWEKWYEECLRMQDKLRRV